MSTELAPRSYNRMTPERVNLFLWAVAHGFTITGAAAAARMSRESFHLWLKDTEEYTNYTPLPWEDAEDCLTNRERYDLARQQAVGAFETVVLADALKNANPAQALRWLKRNSPEDWGDEPAQRTESMNFHVEIDWEKLTPDQLQRIMKGEDISSVLASE